MTKLEGRLKRHRHVRKVIVGTAGRPRLCTYRSNKNVYAQLIDDLHQRTLASASTLDPEIRTGLAKSSGGGKIEAARLVGNFIAKRALNKGISEVVFDRGGYLYHGQVKALADGAREEGLKF